MGKAEIMLKVLSSPDVDAASITAMLGDSSEDPVVQQLLALRAGWDADSDDMNTAVGSVGMQTASRFIFFQAELCSVLVK